MKPYKFRTPTLLRSQRGGCVIAFNYAWYECRKSSSKETPTLYTVSCAKREECSVIKEGGNRCSSGSWGSFEFMI